jgi:phage/conjugal plasmid C-4 type zinc finger TraR family protein
VPDLVDALQDAEEANRADAIHRMHALALAQASIPSACECEECGVDIPLARQKAVPGVQLCVGCQTAIEEERARQKRMKA